MVQLVQHVAVVCLHDGVTFGYSSRAALSETQRDTFIQVALQHKIVQTSSDPSSVWVVTIWLLLHINVIFRGVNREAENRIQIQPLL